MRFGARGKRKPKKNAEIVQGIEKARKKVREFFVGGKTIPAGLDLPSSVS
jgi:hypothetical protein